MQETGDTGPSCKQTPVSQLPIVQSSPATGPESSARLPAGTNPRVTHENDVRRGTLFPRGTSSVYIPARDLVLRPAENRPNRGSKEKPWKTVCVFTFGVQRHSMCPYPPRYFLPGAASCPCPPHAPTSHQLFSQLLFSSSQCLGPCLLYCIAFYSLSRVRDSASQGL